MNELAGCEKPFAGMSGRRAEARRAISRQVNTPSTGVNAVLQSYEAVKRNRSRKDSARIVLALQTAHSRRQSVTVCKLRAIQSSVCLPKL